MTLQVFSVGIFPHRFLRVCCSIICVSVCVLWLSSLFSIILLFMSCLFFFFTLLADQNAAQLTAAGEKAREELRGEQSAFLVDGWNSLLTAVPGSSGEASGDDQTTVAERFQPKAGGSGAGKVRKGGWNVSRSIIPVCFSWACAWLFWRRQGCKYVFWFNLL